MYITLELWRFIAILALCLLFGMLANRLVFGRKIKGKKGIKK